MCAPVRGAAGRLLGLRMPGELHMRCSSCLLLVAVTVAVAYNAMVVDSLGIPGLCLGLAGTPLPVPVPVSGGRGPSCDTDGGDARARIRPLAHELHEAPHGLRTPQLPQYPGPVV
jgi:hypothetical protein